MKTLDITEKQKELYEQFRAYNNMDEVQKLAFKARINEEASNRSEAERESYRQAIQLNVNDVRRKLEEIERQLTPTVKDK